MRSLLLAILSFVLSYSINANPFPPPFLPPLLPPLINGPVFINFGSVGPISIGNVSLPIDFSGADSINAVSFENKGARAVTIDSLKIRTSESRLNIEGKYLLPPSKKVNISLEEPLDEIERVEFYSSGATSRIEVRGRVRGSNRRR